MGGFSPRAAKRANILCVSDRLQLNSVRFQSICVYEYLGRPGSGPLPEVALHYYAACKAIKVVRIPLHHHFALRQVLGLVVDASNARLFV